MSTGYDRPPMPGSNGWFEAIADQTPIYRDRDIEPEPVGCKACNRPMYWRWYEYKGRLRPKWLQPPRDICDDCHEEAEARHKIEQYRARQKAAGIPERYQRYSFTDAILQPLDPEHGDLDSAAKSFQSLCRTGNKVGVTRGNLDAFEFCRDWGPGSGSAWLWGEVGGGKSHLASMLGNKLLRPNGEMQEVYIDGVMHVRINHPRRVLFTSDEQLLLDSKQSMADSKARREDGLPNPVRALIKAELVIYDDIGTGEDKWTKKLREEVVNSRYMATRPTIFTSNSSPKASEHLFSPRMVDRFHEMLGGESRVYCLRDSSWRQA